MRVVVLGKSGELRGTNIKLRCVGLARPAEANHHKRQSKAIPRTYDKRSVFNLKLTICEHFCIK